jgi:hypothetical protein
MRKARAFQQAIDEFTDAGRVHAVLPSSPSEGHVLFKARGVSWQELRCGERHTFFFLLLQKSVSSDLHRGSILGHWLEFSATSTQLCPDARQV